MKFDIVTGNSTSRVAFIEEYDKMKPKSNISFTGAVMFVFVFFIMIGLSSRILVTANFTGDKTNITPGSITASLYSFLLDEDHFVRLPSDLSIKLGTLFSEYFSFSGKSNLESEQKIWVNELMEGTLETCPIDLIAYWKLDETGGSDYIDYFGGNNGMCDNEMPDKCPTPVEPEQSFLNNAQSFDGNDEINVPAGEAFNWGADSNFSIEVWVNVPETENCDGSRVFVGRHAVARAWWVGCDHGTNMAVFSIRDSKSVGLEISAGPALNDGQWHHVVAVRDGSKDENQLYVDGVLAISAPVNYLGDWISDKNISIGYHNVWNYIEYDPSYHFAGILDEIAIYGRALSLTEIQYHYNNRLPERDYCEPVSLTVSTVGSGSVVESPTGPLYKLGQVVTLNANPEEDIIFYSWRGDLVSFNNPTTITMDGDKTIIATFQQPISWTLTVDTMGQGEVLADPGMDKYPHRTWVSLSAVPNPGWVFAGWTGALGGTDNPVNLMMTADSNITASFTKLDPKTDATKIFLPLGLK
jgi:uncharacterized repeat protein (TIGR02543 family)